MKLVRESLNEQVLNEIGEATLKPYKWKQVTPGGLYEFYTEDKDKYVVHFYSHEDDGVYLLDFFISGLHLEYDQYKYISNKGRIFRVLVTVLDIVKTKVNKDKRKKIEKIIISSEKNYDKDNRRSNIYKKIIEKNLPNDWYLQERSIKDKTYLHIIRKDL